MTTDSYEPDRAINAVDDGHGHAVVLGAGIAGLLAARVLAETFDRVTVIDRDVLAGEDFRRGVPQGLHPHLLLDRGRQIMEELFPGLTDALVARGAATKEVLVGSRVYLHGQLVRQTPTGLTSVMASRPLLEGAIRAKLMGVPGVRVVQRTAATGLEPDHRSAPSRVVGVRVTRLRPTAAGEHPPSAPSAPGPDSGRGELVRAELVVDATGRGSRAAGWLAALAFPQAPEERLDIDLGYVSRLYRRRPDQLDGHSLVTVSAMPGFRGGGAIAMEGERWLVMLSGMLGDHPPAAPDGFEAFARTLSVPDIYDLVVSSDPLGDPVPYRYSSSLRRHYEHVKNPPEGFLAIGDAVCSVNPTYAHGMTAAAQQALALRDCLRAGKTNLPARFYRRAGQVTDVPWSVATGADLRYPQVRGRRGTRDRILGTYVERLQVAAHRDATVARALMRTVHMVSAPSTLVRPAVVAGVIRFGLHARPFPRPRLVDGANRGQIG